MEGRLSYKIVQLEDALDNFEQSLAIDTEALDDILVDSVKSGRIQKFEFCLELLWKTIKVYLLEVNGIDVNSPKSVIKEFYNLSFLNLDDYEDLLGAVDDMNRLSHIYGRDQFEEIYQRVILILPLFRRVLNLMNPR